MTDASPRPSLSAALVYGVAASPIGLWVVVSELRVSPQGAAWIALFVLVIPVLVAGVLGSALDRGRAATAVAAAQRGIKVVALSFPIWTTILAMFFVVFGGLAPGELLGVWLGGAVYGFVVTSPVVVPGGIVAALVLRALRAAPEQG